MLVEDPREYLVGRVADLMGNPGNRQIALLEKFTGFLHSQLRQVNPRRNADALFEHAREMERGKLRVRCQLVQADVFGQTRAHQLQSASLRTPCKTALRRRERCPTQPAQLG